MSVVLFWDIDGTLLWTGRAGILALEEAFGELVGGEVDLSELPTAGLTDAGIAAQILEQADGSDDEERIGAFLRSYERRLPDVLPRRRGHVLPNVRPILEDLAPRPGVLSLLLTGNTQAGAAAKLAHYGLDRFFDGAGAFCVGLGSREEIAHRALQVAEERLGTSPPREGIYVIGDTPHDVRCGMAIGARTIAVATGSYPADVLGELDPWLVLEELPEAERFRSLVGIA